MDWTNRRTRIRLLVVAIAVLALGVRLVALGARVAHQDEARVAYWAYRYMESGVYWYRPIVHGPFLTIVNSHVFALLGASDFSMRLVVALVGGALPLVALLFGDRLRDSETLALALVLAANPVLLYYSRFYRNDLLLAGFMLVAFGFFIRAYDHGRPFPLYLGVGFFALAFTTKENALVYPVTWLGALALLADRRLLMGTARSPAQALGNATRRARTGLRRWWLHLALAVVEFFAVFVFFYAPRGRAAEPEPTLGATLAEPTKLLALVGEAVLGSWHAFVEQWGSGSGDAYLDTAGALWSVLGAGAPVLLAFALVGFLVDRYTGERPRDVVAFTFFWGFASALGYPVIVDNPFPWEVIHVIVPLAVPAAVGLALVARVGLARLRSRDVSGPTLDRSTLAAVAAALVLVLAAGQVGVTAYDTSFASPQSADNELVQYAQSSSEMKPLLHDIRRIVRANDGTDVLFYGNDPDFDGDELHAPNPDSHLTPTAGDGWFERLPFAWYLEASAAETNSTDNATAVRQAVRTGERPPVVIAFGPTDTCSKEYDNASDIDQYMGGYERYEVQRFLFDSGCTISSTMVYVDESYLNSTANSAATRAPRPALSPS
ncbi:flippase activity-associated protein Agl23 [Halococcus sp. AFM35]|uniref:flippase activity-associated protein Agl23 n=1 Tax=Halococcus sp. AFM35 TaxID=3421653 RepID=UPI003EBC43F4